MWSYENKGLIGLPFGALIGEADEAVPGAWLKRYLNGGANVGIRTELVGRRGDGMPFPVEMRVSETLSGEKRIYTACARAISDPQPAAGRLRRLSNVSQESLTGSPIPELYVY